jgi:O-antigen/teichoic acid export membrane protein
MRAILINAASVIGGELSVRAANFVALLFIARAYGGTTLGACAVSLAVITTVLMFADNGLQTFAITELSGRSAGRNQIIGQLYIFKTILVTIAILLLALIAYWLKWNLFLWEIGAWITLRTALQSYSQLQMAVLKSVAEANAAGAIQAVHSLILLFGIWFVHMHRLPIVALLAWFSTAQFTEYLLTFPILLRAGCRPSIPVRIAFWAAMRKSTPFGITYGLANLIVRSDTIVLSTLVPLSILGIFSAANSVLLIVYVAAWLLGSVLLPRLVQLSTSHRVLHSYVRKWARILLLASVPIAFVAFLCAPKVMLLLFGPSLAKSGSFAAVIALACPFILFNALYTSAAIAMNKRVVFMGLFAATAIIAIGLDYLLGLRFGAMGIAIAIVIREVAMTAAFWLLVSGKSSVMAQVEYPITP